MGRWILLAFAIASGCKGNEKAQDKPPAPAPAAPAPAAPAPKAAKAKPAEDPAARAAYRAGMRKGRKATDAKQWADALAGFDAALAAKPGDPRALAERGFARLLEGSDLDAATRDFDRAASSTKDTTLLSQIWFNRGLVEEKHGNGPNALAAFVIANTLRPTKAAQAKLAGQAACPVSVARDVAVPDHAAIEAADWLALATALPHDDDAAPKTAAEAWKLLTDEDAEPALPAAIRVEGGGEVLAYVVWRHGEKLRAQPVATATGGRCPGTAIVEIVKSDGGWIHARAREMFEGGYTFMCEGKDGEPVECTGKDGEVSAGTACLGGTATRKDIAIDAATGRWALSLEQPEVEAPAQVELAAGGLKISGLGCDRVEAVNAAK